MLPHVEKITLLRVIPTVTNDFVIVSDISSGSIYDIYFLTFYSGILSDIIFYSGVLFGIYSDILSDMGTAGPQPRALDLSGQRPLRSSARGWCPTVPREIWSSRLRSGSAHRYMGPMRSGSGVRCWKEGRKEGRKEVSLIKSRDTHLAGRWVKTFL